MRDYIKRDNKTNPKILWHLYEKRFNNVCENLLSDGESKQTYMDIIKFRLFNDRKLNYRKKITPEELSNIVLKKGVIKFWNWNLDLLNLQHFGFPIKVYSIADAIHTILNQYRYANNNVEIDIRNGDYVIDGGGCYGDTALCFAQKAGNNGKVFSYEFLNDNLEIFDKNLALNPNLKDNIKISKKALWRNSKSKLYVLEDGPGTKCSKTHKKYYDLTVNTESIDDFVKNNKIEKIDFIKLDIEGSELDALKGAKHTIKTFKPRLAICLYHDIKHFFQIPEYLHKICPEYKMYVGHHTNTIFETVLYATVE